MYLNESKIDLNEFEFAVIESEIDLNELELNLIVSIRGYPHYCISLIDDKS